MYSTTTHGCKFVCFLCVFCVLRCLKDTLKWRVLDIVPWHGGRVEARSAGELAHQMVLEVLSALILLTTVDKDLILKPWEINQC